MTVRWGPTALHDIESLHAYVAEDNFAAAAETVERILSGIDNLARFAEIGRKGRVPGTRELIIAPYVVVYRVSEDTVELVAIIHSARKWPDAF